MNTRAPLHPAGAVARRFQSSPGEDLSWLLEAAEDHGLDPRLVFLARDLVGLQHDLTDEERRALLCLVLVSLYSERQGSTRLPLDFGPHGYLAGRLDAFLSSDAGPAADDVLRVLARIVREERAPQLLGRPGEFRPLLVDDGFLYHQRMLHFEERLATALSARLAPGDALFEPQAIARALDDVLAHPTYVGRGAERVPMALNAEQQQAVRLALSRPLSVITGGPGTGKTSVVVSILRTLARLLTATGAADAGGPGSDLIALAAPTGKAANRMGEAIGEQLASLVDDGLASMEEADRLLFESLGRPRTLHRLLGYSPARGTFYHHENNRLVERVIIVDEASMIDLFMMERLVNAVRPGGGLHGAHLVLLGDAEQLPSVDAGAILRDLVPVGSRPGDARSFVVRLEQSYRMDPRQPNGRRIFELARQINAWPPDAGAADLAAAADSTSAPGPRTLLDLEDPLDPDRRLVQVRSDVASLEGRGVEQLVTPADFDPAYGTMLGAFVDHWFDRRIRALDDFDALITDSYVLGRAAHARPGDDTPHHEATHQEATHHEATYHEDTSWRFEPESRARLTRLFAHLQGFRVLTLTRVHPTGAERLNAAFHARFLAHRAATRSDTNRPDTNRSDTTRSSTTRARWEFVAGEPVLMLRNDYERGLFNGDQGVVLWVRRATPDGAPTPPELMVVFAREQEFVAFSLGALRGQIEHAFAMTVHRAQGSEFRHVALVLPSRDLPLLTRELLYTAITRASQSVTIVGHPDRLEAGARRQLERFSGVAARLGLPNALEDTAALEDIAAPASTSAAPAATSTPPARPVQGVLFSDS